MVQCLNDQLYGKLGFDAIERMDFAKLAPSFMTEITYYNFPEIKQMRDHLVSTSDISQADADTITGLFAEQNIDLDSYGE